MSSDLAVKETASLVPLETRTAPLTLSRVHRRLRGGSGSFLVECDNGAFYVLKTAANDQGPNLLANEWLGSQLARSLGILVPEAAVIEVTTDALASLGQPLLSLNPGLHFGSRMVGEVSGVNRPSDYLPRFIRRFVSNERDVLSMLILDTWGNMWDDREAVFMVDNLANQAHVYFIDHGHMFGGPHWSETEPSRPLRFRNEEFHSESWNAVQIDEQVTRMERIIPDALRKGFSLMPRSWYKGDVDSFQSFYMRRLHKLRELIEARLSASPNCLGVHDHFGPFRI